VIGPRHKACKRELRRSALMPADIAIRQFKATAPVKRQQEECQMAYLELSPAIVPDPRSSRYAAPPGQSAQVPLPQRG
jgi:hypothetical protein